MNFVGKFGANQPPDDLGSHSHADTHVQVQSVTATHVPAGAIIVPDAHLLFTGDFKRSGVDLILSGDDRELVLHDYFKGEKHAALASPDGAHLTGDVVSALTGHVDYAQADGSAGAARIIGHVSKLVGTATAVRNGVSIILNNGDNVEKGDVVQTGAGSTLGLTFIDGTVFGLSSNARMVLNEMVYDPNGSSNSSLLSLVAGTISFVAGETAKHGDMKIDTPVATMGIRGTAVLVEIDFNVPQGNAPEAKFQVLVEPDGTTGSYILFDKTTLQPLVTVDRAGQFVHFANGNVTYGNALMSPEVQKLITDVFSIKFTDSNTKTYDHDHFTDTPIPQSFAPFILANGASAIPVIINVPAPSTSSAAPTSSSNSVVHIPGPPQVAVVNLLGQLTSDFDITELANKTADTTDFDTVSGKVNFVDVNAGDTPTVSTTFVSYTYQDAQHNDVTAGLSLQQQADIAAVEANLVVVQTPGNKNTGSATWTYSVADGAFDFLAAGESVTLTYKALVDNNYAPSAETGYQTFTITITGTNDAPVITTGPQLITFTGGITTPGGDLTSSQPTSGTLSFNDVDLTDTHSVSTALQTAVLSGGGTVPPGPLAIFETALSASIGTDSTGTGNGTINWQLADLPVYLADFVPDGQTLTLTYAVTVTDEHGATSTQDVTVTITGNNTPAVVWIATTAPGSPSGGLWSDPSNWETGTVPTASDDAIIITNQLIGLTPSYPVTIDAPAVAKTVTMNDYGTSPPQLINESTLTIGDTFDISADSIVDNSGTITVGGLMEVVGTSDIENSGTIKLNDGGDFEGQSTINNNAGGTIEVAGGTLNVLVDIANSDLVLVDANAKLTLNGAAIAGGTVTNNGEIDLTGAGVLKNGSLGNAGQIKVSGNGNELDDENVTANNSLEILAGGALLLDDGTAITNGGTIKVDGTGTLTLDDATITGGTVTNNGTVEITGTSTVDGATFGNNQLTVDASQILTLDGTTITGGSITDSGTVNVDATKTLKLSGVALTGGAITNLGTVEITGTGSIENDSFGNNQLTIDASQILTLDGTTITGGSITNNGTVNVDATKTLKLSGVALTGGAITNLGTVEITGTGSIENDAFGNNQLTVDASQILTLDGTTITGGSITNNGTVNVDATKTLKLSGVALTGGAITNLGTVEIIGTGSIENDAFGNNQLTVDASQILTLDGTTITGGSITDTGTVNVDATKTLKLSGVALTGGAITNLGTVEITGTGSIENDAFGNNQLTVDASQILTLDGTTITGGSITDSGTINVDASKTLKLSGVALTGGAITNLGTVEITGTGSIENDSFGNNQLTVDASQILTLDGTTVTGGSITDTGTINVDATKTLKLSGVALTGGAITNLGTVEITGTGSIENDSFGNNQLTIDASQILTLDGTTITGGSITDSGTVNVDATKTLKLSGVALTGGAITNLGTVEITGTGSIENDSFGNNQLTIDASQILTLDGTTITGGSITDSGTVNVDATKTLKLSGVALTGGAMTNLGTVEITGTGSIENDAFGNNQLTIDASQILTLDGTTVTGGSITDTGTVNVDATKTLKLSGVALTGGAITNLGTVEITGTGSIENDAFGNNQLTIDASQILTLDGTTVTGGSITDTGTVNVDATKTLKLSGVALTGGAITNLGTVEITGTGSIENDSFGNNQLTIDASQILTLDGTTITGGSITDTGTVNVDASKTLKLSGVALTGGAITNLGTVEITGTGSIENDAFGNNQLTIDASQILTLDGTTITGGSITDTGTVNVDATKTLKLSGVALTGGAITNLGTVEITGTGSIENDAFGNNQLTVDANQILTLDGTTITGGNITDSGTVNVDASKTLKLSGVALTGGAITNLGTVEITGTGSIENDSFGNNQLTIDASQILTLDGTTITGGSITDSGTVNVDASKTLKLSGVALTGGAMTNLGTVEITGTGSIENDAFGNNQLTIDASQILTLDGTTITGGSITDSGTVNVDATKTLKLSGVALTGGAITNLGTVEITGTGSIENDSFGNNQLTIDASQILTLDGTTITGGSITDSGTVNVDATKTLKLSGVALTGGAMTNLGTVEITGTGSIENDAFGNNQLTIDASQILTLDGTTVTGGSITDTGTVNVDATKTLKLSGVALTGGAITNLGTVEITGTGSIENDSFGNNQLTVDASQILTLDGTTITGGSITNNGTINVDATKTLNIVGVAISGGAITNAGNIDSTGTSSISNVGITNSGTIEATSGVLTIDPTVVVTLSNSGTLEANGGELDITTEPVSNTGTLQAIDDSTLKLTTTTVTNTDGGTVSVELGSTLDLITAIITGGTLTNDGTLDSTGTSSISNVGITNSGTIEATSGVLTIDPTVVVTLSNSGTLEANGGELDITTEPVSNTGTLQAIDDSTLKLTTTTVTNTDGGTVSVELGSTLDLISAIINGGTLTNSGTLDSTGTSSIGVGTSVDNEGTLEATGGTLTIHDAVTNDDTLKADGGTLVIDGDVTGTGSATITGGGTLELGGADAQTVTFDGIGTLQLDSSSNFTGTIDGLADGDVIHLAGTTIASAYFDGSTLVVNGQPTSFQIADVPAGDTVGFKVDPLGGYDLKVLPQVLSVGTPGPTGGVEGTAIQLGFSDTVTGANLAKFVISGIPDGAILTDGTHTYTSDSADGSVDVASWTLSSLTIKPADAANFTLSALVTAVDANGYDYTLPATEVVTVTPQAPTVEPVAEVGGVGQPIALDLGTTVNGLTDDSNTLKSLMVSGIPLGVTLTDGTPEHTYVSDSADGSIDVASWNLSSLKITSTDPGSFSLGVAVTTQDAEHDLSTTVNGTESVTVNGLPVITPASAEVIGVGQSSVISGISLSETGDTTGETFTMTLSDTHGQLSTTAVGDGDTVAVTNSGTTLTITGSLSDVNSDLSHLTDSNPTPGSDPITITASDSFGNSSATAQTTDVTVNGLPVITPASAEIIGVGQSSAISGISLSETGDTTGETFTMTLSDTHGQLSTTAVGDGDTVAVTNSGTTLTITGSLSDVNSDLSHLTDSNPTPGSDPITITASDSFGNSSATAQTTDVTVNGLPVITPASAEIIGVGQSSAISGISLAETGDTTGETFTVTLSDTHGQLSTTAVGDGDTVAVTNSGTTLTITGSLSDINSDLATLHDSNPTPGSDAITITATDSFTNSATSQTTDVTVNGLPVITPASAEIIGVGQSTAITGISLAETGDTTGETFTVTLSDTHGQLSTTAVGDGDTVAVTNSGTTLTITGSLSDVNSDLSHLTDSNATPGSDAITITASDSFGNSSATAQTTDVTVNGLPVITPASAEIIGVGQSTAITGISLSETGDTTGETFTVTLSDANGDLSATQTGTTDTVTVSGTTLTITGSLSDVNNDLATLHDSNATPGSDAITITATDSFGNSSATSQTTDVTVNGLPVITPASAEIIGVGQSSAISGISLAETGDTTGETFTVTLSDTHGQLSAITVGDGDTVAVTNSGTTLTITGSLSDINSDLATLHDSNATPGSDAITITATDSFGNSSATAQTTDVTVNGLPVITPASAEIIGVGQSSAISGISLSETGDTTGETFTVTLSDANGQLSATQTGTTDTVTVSGTTLTITGSLSDVNSDLATLHDSNTTTGSDSITITATDSFGNSATSQTTDVTVNGPPVITPASAEIIGVGQSTAITGISLAETGDTTGETFTVTLSDANGDLSATQTGTTDTVTVSGTTLTITGSLSDINNDLATLHDSNATPGSDAITITATDSFGNSSGTSQTTDVTVNGLPVITPASAEIIGVGQSTAITGISLAETGDTTGETFTVTLSDANGQLSATQTGTTDTVTVSGTTLTITGSLSDINNDLATLHDSNATPGSDAITITASDSFGNSSATSQTTDVTVNGLPVITPASAEVIGVGQSTAITGISLSETGDTTGETFTVTLSDANGDLSATQTGTTDTVTVSGTTLTITGSLSDINNDLATLHDSNATPGSDAITITATDSFGNSSATSQTTDVTVNGLPVITPASAEIIGVGQSSAISGISLSETGDTTGETFTVTLSDSYGQLSATAVGDGDAVAVTNSGTTLTITGSLSDINSDLATLTDTNTTTGSDSITITATDSFGNSATSQTVDVTVNPSSSGPSEPFVWIAGDGNWSDAINWNNDAVPGASDQVQINSDATVTIGSVEVDSSLLLDGGAILTGGTLTLGSGGTLDVEIGPNDENPPAAELDGIVIIGTNAALPSTPASAIEVGLTTTATLLLVNGTSINGGTLTIGTSGTLDIENRGVDFPGATLDGVAVFASGAAIDVDLSASGAVLALDDGTAIAGGSLTIGNSGSLDIEVGPHGQGGLGGGADATLDDVKVYNDSGYGNIYVGETSAATLVLEDGTTIEGDNTFGGTLTIGSGSTLQIEYGTDGSGATLDGLIVDNGGTIQVDGSLSPTVTLTLDDGTTINGGALNIGSSGVLDVEIGGSAGGTYGYGYPDATLDGVTVTNSGTIDVDLNASGAILALDDGTTISGGALSIGSFGTLDVEVGPSGLGGDPDATLDGVTVTNAGLIEVDQQDDGAVLALVNGTTISGGTLAIDDSGTLEITGGVDGSGATLEGGIVVNNDDVIQIDASSVLALDDATLGGGTITNNGTIDVTGSSTIGGDAALAGGTLEVESQQTLTLDGASVAGSAIVVGPYSFTSLDDAHANPAVSAPSGIFVTGLNGSGTVVGEYQDANGTYQSFVYENGGYTAIQDPSAADGNGLGTTAEAINDSGVIVGVYSDAGGFTHGFVYNAGTYSTVDVAGSDDTVIYGINDSGEIFGSYTVGGNDYAFTASSDGSNVVTVAGPAGAVDTNLAAINSSGAVLGDYYDASNSSYSYGFVFDGTTYTPVIDPSAPLVADASGGQAGTWAYGMNNAGDVVGTYYDANGFAHGFVYEPNASSQWITLDDPAANHATNAYSINNEGEVLGDYFDSNNVAHAFVYDIATGTYINFNEPLAVSNQQLDGTYANPYVSGINDAGQVAGTYIDSDGNLVGYLADPVTGASLQLTDGTTVADGSLTVGGGDTLDVEVGSNGPGGAGSGGDPNTAYPDGTLDGVAVTNSGTIDVDLNASGAILALNDGTTISGGAITIGSDGTLDVEIGPRGQGGESDTGFDATLDGVAVSNAGTIDVDLNDSGAFLALDDGTTITGGTLSIGSGGTVEIVYGSNESGATFDGVSVDDLGVIQVGNAGVVIDPTLTLDDGTTISGGTLIVEGNGILEIAYGSNDVGATLDGVSVSNFGTIQVGSAGVVIDPTLTLDDATTITGGTLTIEGNGTLDVEVGPDGQGAGSGFDATLDGVTVANGGTIDVDPGASGAILALDDGTTITGGTLSIGNAGTLEIIYGSSGAGATLYDVSVRNDGNIQVGDSLAGDPTLTLDHGTTITGGTLSIGNSDALEIEAGASATLDGVNVVATDFTSSITLDNGSTLTLQDGTDISGGTIAFTGTGDTLIVDQSSSFSSAVSGFGSGDTIDFSGIASSEHPQLSYDSGTGLLTVGSQSITLSGNYQESDFVLVGDQNGGTEVLFQPTATITVLTPDGVNFQTNPNPLTEMGSGSIQAGADSSTFTVVDAASSNEFVFDGYNFTYDNSGDVTGGTITAIHEFASDGTTAIADFTGLFDAASWMADVQQAAQGNFVPLNKLVANYTFNFVGGSGPDGFGEAGHSETLNGGAGNDLLDPGKATGGQHTLTGGAGSDTFVFGAGYGAVTITDFDQGNNPGSFDQSEGDVIQLNGFNGAQPTVTYVNGNTVADFGNGDVLTLLHVNPANLTDSDFANGGGGGNDNGNGGGNNNGPTISNAGNTVTYAGTPVVLDPSISVSDTTGTVTSVNAWISSGAQSGDTLSIDGNTDGTIDDSDGSTIHYHFDGNAISLTEASGNVTLDDFDAALQSIQFTPGAADGARTITWAAHEAVNTSATVTTTVNVGPVLNSFALTVVQGGTTVLSNSDFNVSDPGFTNLTYTVGNVTGGQFEVFNGQNWVAAPTGGFTTTQIAAGQVEFVQDGSANAPTFSIHVSDDGPNASPDIAPTVTFTSVAVANSSITASPATMLADGTSSIDLTVTAKDANGNPVSGATVALSATGTGNTFAPASGVTDANGMFTATLASSVIENETIQAVIGGTVDETVAVNFVADHWNNSSGGDWTTGSDWSYGVPASNDVAAIDASGSYTVTISTAVSLAELSTVANATLQVTTGTLTLTGTATSDLAGAITNGGTITVQNGTLQLDNTLTNTGHTVVIGSGAYLDLNGATLNGGTVTDGGTIDVSGTSTIGAGAQVNGGALSVGSGATLKIEGAGATFNDVDVTNDGTIQVDPSLAPTLVLSGGTSITGGGLLINSAGALTISAGTVGSGATLDDVTVTNDHTINVNSSVTLDLDGGTSISGGTITDSGTIDITGATTIEGSADLTGGGQITIESGQTLTLDNVTLAGVSIDGDASATGTIDNTGTITLGTGGMTLNGSTFKLALNGTGTLNLNGKTIQTTVTGDTLENDGNTISGIGTIGSGATTPLSVNNVSGIIEALGGILSISNGTFLTNSGLIEAASGATLKVTIGTIKNNGTAPQASSAASGILVDGTFEVANPTANGAKLQLGGGGDGVMVLNGGTIEGNSTNAETFENVNNLIAGYGNIGFVTNGVSTDLLTMQNDALGVIDANVSGHVLAIHTGANVITNAGTMEATGGATLDISSALTNSGSLTASDGGILSLTDETITNTGTINIDGSVAASQIVVHGSLTLEGGNGTSTGPGEVILTGGFANAILSDLSAATLENVDNTISGSGSIGDAYLSVQNDQYGVIDATGVLTLNAAALTNNGVMEATGGGKLVVDDNVSGTGSIHVGQGSTVELGGTSANGVTFDGAQGTLQIDSAGTATHFSIVGNGQAIPAGDIIDLPNITFNATADSYLNDTITVGDGQGHTVTIDVVGGIGAGNGFTFQADATGGTELYDPPVSGDVPVTPAVDSGAAPPVVPAAPGQSWTPSASGDSFVFNFGNVGHTPVVPTDFHSALDQAGGMLLTNFLANPGTISELHSALDHFGGMWLASAPTDPMPWLTAHLQAQLHGDGFHVV